MSFEMKVTFHHTRNLETLGGDNRTRILKLLCGAGILI